MFPEHLTLRLHHRIIPAVGVSHVSESLEPELTPLVTRDGYLRRECEFSYFFDWLRMNRDAGDLREFFLYAGFEFAGDVVDLGRVAQ
jgi:hypothetical protein